MITLKTTLRIVGGIVALGVSVYGYAIFEVLDGASRSSLTSRRAQIEALSDRKHVAIVLGMGPRPSSPILDRAELAVELDRRGYVSMFVTSGGQGRDEREPEARTLRNALVQAGVPANRVFEESTSTSTLENLTRSRAVLADANVTSEPVLVVTHAFHARRVEVLAERIGMKVIVIGTAGERLDRRAYRTAREGLALTAAWLGR